MRLGIIILCVASAAGQTPPSAEQRSRDLLETALHSKNPDTRKEAVVSLSLVGAREPYLSELEAMLGDKDVEVRLATIATLVDLKNKRTLAELHKALADETPEVSFAAARALWDLKDPEGRKALLAILEGDAKTSSPFFTKQKRDAMRMMHTPRAMLTFAVVHGAGFAPVPGLGAGIASMQGILSNPNVSGRATATLLLGRDVNAETFRALRDALHDDEWQVRAAAVHSLALRNDPALAKDFVSLLDDDKEPVRLRAAAAWLRLSGLKTTAKPASRPAAAAK